VGSELEPGRGLRASFAAMGSTGSPLTAERTPPARPLG